MFETTMSGFSTLLPDLIDDPYPQYDRLRARAPVCWSAGDNAWILSRYADVARVMKDESFRVVEVAAIVDQVGRATGKQTFDLARLLEAVLFLRNPPGHAEARQFLVAVLTATPMAAHRPVIEAVARGLLAPAAAGAALDAVTGYADLVPPLFMGRLLGLPESGIRLLMQTVSEVTMTFDRGRSPRFYERVNRTVTAALPMFLEAIGERRARGVDDGDPEDGQPEDGQPEDGQPEDGLTRMIRLSDARFGLDDRTIATRALFLLIAGVETTSALIGNAIRAVVERPAVMRALRADPGLIDRAIDEVLRHDGPVRQATRVATREAVIGGQAIRAGERVVLLLGAAHRDPAAYEEPSRFDLARGGPPALGFGIGLHHCLGATLARLETRVALERLLVRSPCARFGTSPEWWPHRTLRRMKSFHVNLASNEPTPTREG